MPTVQPIGTTVVDKLTKVHLSPIWFTFRRSVYPRRKLRLSDGTNVMSGEFFRRMCKLTERLRVNEFVDR